MPTLIEQGDEEFVIGNWTGIVAPAKAPKRVIGKLATDITCIIARRSLADVSVAPMGGAPD